MAAAWRNLMKLLGFGKKEEKKPVRYHPYDEVSDEQLDQGRRQQQAPRYHPYDEVTDEQLEQNRANEASTSQQASGARMVIASDQGSKSAPSGTPGLNYVQVDVQSPGGATRPTPSRQPQQPDTIYSDVRTSTSTAS